jgi:hypothetical protein
MSDSSFLKELPQLLFNIYNRVVTRGGEYIMRFIHLRDVPQTYDSYADYLVKVKTDETGLEFIDPNTSGIGDHKVSVSVDDATYDFLDEKVTAGKNIQITVTGPGANESLMIENTGFVEWEDATSSRNAVINRGYVTNNVSQVTITLPATAAAMTMVAVTGKGAGGWKVAQNAGQKIYFGGVSTLTGVTGYMESTHYLDGVILLCITANTDWKVVWNCGMINLKTS